MGKYAIKLIESIRSPLGFFVLSLIIVESFTVVILNKAQEPTDGHIYAALALSALMFFCIVISVSLLVWHKPTHLVFESSDHIKQTNLIREQEKAYGEKLAYPQFKVFHSMESQPREHDPNVQDLFKLLEDSQFDEAIKFSRELVANDKKYYPYLLTALVLSTDRAYLSEAESLLSEHGNAAHYNKVAFSYWEYGQLPKAIKLAETGLERFGDDSSSHEAVGAIKNSLAYYYADSADATKSESALKLSGSEVERRREINENEQKNLSRYADALDTLGYVKIQFGNTKEEIEEGLDYCLKALKLGSDENLYKKHHARAMERLAMFDD